MRFGALSGAVPRGWQQALAFVLVYVSYMCFYFDRKNYAFWLNELVRNVGRPKEEVSKFGSVMEMAYGAGKLVAGPLVDSSSPVLVLCSTLAVASVCNLLMFQTGWVTVDTGLWAVNGLVQSAAWPALAAVFMNWFQSSPNRGIWYSVLSTNQNVGSALTPIMLTPLVALYGWRAAVVAPGAIGLCYAAVLALFLQEGPPTQSAATSGKAEDTAPSDRTGKGAQAKGWGKTLRELVSSLPLLSLGAGYAFLTCIRVGMQDWSLMLLQDLRGVDTAVARDCLVFLELGGFLGGISAGAVSDRLFAGRRGPTIVLFTAAIAPVLASIAWLPIPAHLLRAGMCALYLVFGFTSFGPHMLVGLTAREVFPQAPSTAGSFTKSLAQFGGTLAGYPLSLVVSSFGWSQVFVLWTLCALLGALCFAPLLAEQQQQARADGHAKTE